jgi:HemK-related putative methylase
LWWRFRLFQQHRHTRLALEQVDGRPFLLLPGVMNPRLFRSGPFLARAMVRESLPAQPAVLDVGTGSGILAVTAATRGARVIAVDVNPVAVRCAQINVLLNQLEERVTVLRGDLFAPVQGQQFDLVLCNPPFFRGRPAAGFDQAWRSDDFAMRFTAGLGDVLAPQGKALVVLSSQGDEQGFLQAFANHGFSPAIASREDLANEILTVYRLGPVGEKAG